MALADQSWYIESAFGTKRPQATRLARSLLAATNPGRKALILSVARRPRQSHHNIVTLLNTAADAAVLPGFSSASQRNKHHRRT
jgi:hypothetical protein